MHISIKDVNLNGNLFTLQVILKQEEQSIKKKKHKIGIFLLYIWELTV